MAIRLQKKHRKRTMLEIEMVGPLSRTCPMRCRVGLLPDVGPGQSRYCRRRATVRRLDVARVLVRAERGRELPKHRLGLLAQTELRVDREM